MQSGYLFLIVPGALLIPGPFVQSQMERMGVPALVGYILPGFIVSVINQQWSFIATAFDNTFEMSAQPGVVTLLSIAPVPKTSFVSIGQRAECLHV